MKITTKLQAKGTWNGKYKLYVGEKNSNSYGKPPCVQKNLSKDDLKNIYGYQDSFGSNSWDAVLIVSPVSKGLDSTDIEHNGFLLTIEEVYTGTDGIAASSQATTSDNTGSMENFDGQDAATSAVETAAKVASWAAEFLKNSGGKMTTVIMDGLLFLADGIQYWASSFQTLGDHTARDFTITYTYDDLKKDAEGEDIKKDKIKNSEEAIGNRDKYTKVSGYKEKETESWQKEINLDKQTEDAYTKENEIPVMVGDVYNVIVNHIDFFDINFFTGNKDKKADGKTAKHAKDSTWMVLRNFVTSVIHIVIYISATTLILSLIYNGVKIVGHSLDNPSARAEYKKGLERFWKALLMLVGSVIIMGLCIFGAKTFYEDIESNDSYELPIRVNVENAEYSFSTTFTGYVRYMAGIEDIDQALKKTVYTMGYIVLAIINFIAMLGMAISVFALFGLSMLGPILAALYVFDKQGPISYASWVELYVGFSIIPIFVMSIGYKLVLSTVG